ncbi:hypothetical protein JXA02_02655 [candidate division KSB1 bacterium]|nr:hypothetical protein [candidate division KSB1 bacterium]RQW10188.1 MAG: hypothetical protein EH222_02890 [candidate division KSB1 bacterium]
MTLFFLCALHACVTEPQVHVGTTYLREQRIKLPHVNGLDRVAKGTSMQIRGVYWPHFYAVRPWPAIVRINPSDQLEFVLLTDSLDVPHGDVVHLTGTPVDGVISGGVYEKKITMLHAEQFTIERATHKVLARAHRDYQTLRGQLHARAVQPGSKLAWPDQPDWQLIVDEKRATVVALFGAADLMYAVDVNLVYDLQGQKLQEIYAHEWFKGE